MLRPYLHLASWLTTSLIAVSLSTLPASAQEAAAIEGKHDWLFYRYEWTTSADLAASNTSLDLIKGFNQALKDNGITLVVAMVPLKARIYQAHLPDQNKLNPYMAGNYQRMAQVLNSAGVKVIDLNTSFLQNVKSQPDKNLFFRLDSHWSAQGAMLAADTATISMETDATLKAILRTIPTEKFSVRWTQQAIATVSRDLVNQLPKNAATYAPEMVYDVEVSKAAGSNNLLGDAPVTLISLVGSSYSKPWTRFPDLLKYSLQKDVLTVAVGADQGSWVGMESYLRDDAFRNNPPKLLIWEMPERDMRAPPAFPYREERYRSDNLEWLQRVSALVQQQCRPSPVTASLPGATKNGELNIQLSPASDGLDYLQAQVSSKTSQTLTLEAMKGDVGGRKSSQAVPVNGDATTHSLVFALPRDGKTYTGVKITASEPGAISITELKMCRATAVSLK
ncbi:hypothetical protein H8L32_26255 [Undibacterium sp. CY18W]|uniref:AlgX/AlgJ SGNH hydrolase-like domain-containing protein n=1 Tax=Undibacterium hunanense TaxID=2762292 RepID=A0ABR6ZZ19_9BURK|nr:hypothetical protein [Undibacterium hunanense]MBC3920994.1 hypothetical protein [Undibacterium hunanense]